MDVASRSNSLTPSVHCARLPISATRATGDLGLAEAALLERLQYLGRRHRKLGEPNARRALDRVRDRRHGRDDGRLTDSPHAVRMAWVRHFDDDRIDHR